MARILIEGGYVVSIKIRDHVIEDGMVAIVDDRIHYIGERSNFDALLPMPKRRYQLKIVRFCQA